METARKTSAGSTGRSTGNNPLVKREEEDEIQASEPMDVEVGRDKPSVFIKDYGKEVLHHAAQDGAETLEKDSDSEEKGQEQSGREVMRRVGPPERRGGPETGAHVYRGSSSTRLRIA